MNNRHHTNLAEYKLRTKRLQWVFFSYICAIINDLSQNARDNLASAYQAATNQSTHGNKQSSSTSAFGSTFGQSAFGSRQQSAFGQPTSTPQSAFASATASGFNKPSTTGGATFGQSSFGQPQPQSAFGSVIKPASGAFSAFANTGPSPFAAAQRLRTRTGILIRVVVEAVVDLQRLLGSRVRSALVLQIIPQGLVQVVYSAVVGEQRQVDLVPLCLYLVNRYNLNLHLQHCKINLRTPLANLRHSNKVLLANLRINRNRCLVH